MAEAPSDSAGTGNVTPPDRVLTVPNALSVIRLVLVPVFLYLLLVSGALGWAVAILMSSGFSDWADGKIARLFDNQSSRLGELLDPAVDRIYMVVVPVAMAVAQSFGFGPHRPARSQSACATTARLRNSSGNSA